MVLSPFFHPGRPPPSDERDAIADNGGAADEAKCAIGIRGGEREWAI